MIFLSLFTSGFFEITPQIQDKTSHWQKLKFKDQRTQCRKLFYMSTSIYPDFNYLTGKYLRSCKYQINGKSVELDFTCVSHSVRTLQGHQGIQWLKCPPFGIYSDWWLISTETYCTNSLKGNLSMACVTYHFFQVQFGFLQQTEGTGSSGFYLLPWTQSGLKAWNPRWPVCTYQSRAELMLLQVVRILIKY